MKKRLLSLLLIVVVVLLGFNTIIKPVESTHFGFTRKPEDRAKPIHSIEAFNSRIAGTDEVGNIYFYNNPHWLYKADTTLKQIDSIYLPFDSTLNETVRKFYTISLQKGKILLSCSNTGKTFAYDLSGNCMDMIHYSGKFTRQIIISSASSVIRSFPSKTDHLRLIKEDNTGEMLALEAAPARNPVEGLINEDGLLLLDQKRSHVLYIHFYNSKVNIFDTNLVLQNTLQTIDSFKGTPISVRRSKHGSTNISPERLVNRNAFIADDKLYILSRLKADNESFSYFKEHTLLDTYNLLDGHYIKTIVLLSPNSEQAVDCIKFRDRIYITTLHRICVYQLSGSSF